jgi:hypothetical protein
MSNNLHHIAAAYSQTDIDTTAVQTLLWENPFSLGLFLIAGVQIRLD